MAGPLAYHRLPDDKFRSIASGYGDTEALAELRASQLSKRLLLLQWVRATADGDAFAVLESVGRSQPDILRSVLGQPFVDAWTSGFAEDAHGGAYLAGLAAAAAVRAGMEVDLAVAAQPGQLVVPGVGLAYGLGTGPARVRCAGGQVILQGPDRTVAAALDDPADQPYWCPYRSIRLGPLTVVVDDLDPYRSRFDMTAHARLRPGEFDLWADQLAAAWDLIRTDHPGYVATVRECLRSIVPLAAPPGGGSVSGTARQAFGAVAVSPQPDGAALALLLLHELQHVKYNALEDLVALVDGAHTGLFEAPWRADPRPAGALLTGAYAHTAVADYWRVRQHRTTGEAQRLARFEAAYWQGQTSRSLRTLGASGALTTAGTRFVAELRATVDGWPTEPTLADGVDDLAMAVSVGWRLRNHEVVDGDLDALAAAWAVGAHRPPLPDPVTHAGTPPGPARPAGLADSLREALSGLPGRRAAGPAEQAYLRGDYDLAAREFATRVTTDGDDAAWAGLAVAWRRSGRSAAALALRDRPELVRALHRRLGGLPDPERVAAWLSGSDQTGPEPMDARTRGTVRREARGGMYYFFLSYSRGDDDSYVKQFFRDLCEEVRVLAGLSPDEEVGFLDSQIDIGTPWSASLVRALATCRTFVALCSPRYIASERCGREWAVFSDRMRASRRDQGGSPTDALIPVRWVPFRQPVPVAVSMIPFADGPLVDGAAYETAGVRQLMRLHRLRDGYLEFVSMLAGRIVQTAPVAPLVDPPWFDDVGNAFREPGSGNPATRQVHLVVAAADQQQVAAIREDRSYYGEHPTDWAPYLPELPEPVAEFARGIVENRGFVSIVADTDHLLDRLEYAKRHNQIVVLLLDAWATRLVEQRRVLAECDQLAFGDSDYPVAVMVPASAQDSETVAAWHQLSGSVRDAMPRLSVSADNVMFRASVLTHHAFAADLQVLLEVVRNRVFAHGTVFTQPGGTPTGRRPILEGP